jgi:hypothetical protein
MKTSAGDNSVVVQTNAVYTKHKLDYSKEEILALLRKQYPSTIPDAFLETMFPAFMLGVEEGLRRVGYRILNKEE